MFVARHDPARCVGDTIDPDDGGRRGRPCFVRQWDLMRRCPRPRRRRPRTQRLGRWDVFSPPRRSELCLTLESWPYDPKLPPKGKFSRVSSRIVSPSRRTVRSGRDGWDRLRFVGFDVFHIASERRECGDVGVVPVANVDATDDLTSQSVSVSGGFDPTRRVGDDLRLATRRIALSPGRTSVFARDPSRGSDPASSSPFLNASLSESGESRTRRG